MAELITAVFVTDPDRPGAAKVLFQPGDDVPERFWPRMTNPGLWKDGIAPTPSTPEQEPGEGEGDSDDSEPSSPGSGPEQLPQPEAEPQPEPEKKPAARKTAATKPASGRKAAAEGTGGQ
jgi:hypothetical protein